MRITTQHAQFTQSIAPNATAISVPDRSHSAMPIFLYFHGCDFGRNGFAMFEFTIIGMRAIERIVFIGFRKVWTEPNKGVTDNSPRWSVRRYYWLLVLGCV